LIVHEQPFLSLCLTAGYRHKPAVLRNTFLQMRRGEVLGLVGQSGSGKSTLALAILRLLALKGGQASGCVYFQGQDLMKLKERELRALRGKEIGLVLQSPLSSLNPALTIGTQLREEGPRRWDVLGMSGEHCGGDDQRQPAQRGRLSAPPSRAT
jgi:ABC-type glutathione transport system ATPase component